MVFSLAFCDNKLIHDGEKKRLEQGNNVVRHSVVEQENVSLRVPLRVCVNILKRKVVTRGTSNRHHRAPKKARKKRVHGYE